MCFNDIYAVVTNATRLPALSSLLSLTIRPITIPSLTGTGEANESGTSLIKQLK